LLDVMMPGLDGYEVCSQLKADRTTSDIPVIFLTGQTEIEDETRGFDVGAVDYIHKPFSPTVVKARVQIHLVLRGVREQLAQKLATIQKELETARQIQLSILPKEVPRFSDLDIAARYIPMTAVAGDFYDFIRAGERQLGVLVADVSGHGMPAALIASMLKIALAGQVVNAADPAKVLAGLNQALCRKFQHHFVTAAYVFVDMERQTLTYAGAGHPPLLFWGGLNEGVREVEENGLFLGKVSWATYTSVELPFSEDSWALLYTDGIPETTNHSGEEFPTGGFIQFLKSDKSSSADQFVDRLLHELSIWAARGESAELNDDITVVALHAGIL
jgi:phosphoserine phosphatase RsbU/P